MIAQPAGTKWPWLVLTATVVLTVVCMKLEGRLWWCDCGAKFLVMADGWSSHTSQHLFDPYSLTHVLHGFTFWGAVYLCRNWIQKEWQLAAATVIEAVWEIVENSPPVIERYRNATAALGYSGDSVGNSLGDILSCAVGFLFARKYGWRTTVAYFVLTEITLIFWIRNSLILETLMLIYPIEPIKAWQINQ